MTRPGVAGGGDGLQDWKVAANILNNQSRTDNKGLSPACGLGVGLTTPHSKKKISFHEMLRRVLEFDGFFGMA
jgi:hypothetical protein